MVGRCDQGRGRPSLCLDIVNWMSVLPPWHLVLSELSSPRAAQLVREGGGRERLLAPPPRGRGLLEKPT